MIDRHLLHRFTIILFFCLYNAGKGCVLPFLTLIFRHVGFTVLEAGILRSIQSIVAIVFSSIFLQVAIKFNKRKLFTGIGILVTSAIYTSILFIPPIIEHANSQMNKNLSLSTNDSIHKVSSAHNQTNISSETWQHSFMKRALFKNATKNNFISINVSNEVNQFSEDESMRLPLIPRCTEVEKIWCLQHMVTFLIFLILLISSAILGSYVEKLVDDSWYEHLDESDNLEIYGEHKLYTSAFTAITLIILSGTVSIVLSHKFTDLQHLMIYFYVSFIIMISSFLVTPFIPMPNERKTTKTNYKKIFRSFQIIFFDYRNLLFTFSVTISGALNACIFDFLLWFLQDNGVKGYMLGLFVAVGITSELPIPFIYKSLIKKVTLNGAMACGLFMFGFRFIQFSLFISPLAILPAQLLQGLSNELIWQTTLVHIDQVSNPGMDRNVHSLLHTLYWGVGYCLGSSLGGLIYQLNGPYLMFWAFGIVAYVWGFIFIVLQWYIPQLPRRTYSKLLISGTIDKERMYRLLNSSNSDSEEDEIFKAALDD